MTERLFTLVDVDARRLHGGSDGWLRFEPVGESRLIARARPALVRGAGGSSFLRAYFQPQAPVPWSGLLRVNDATVAADGVVMHGDEVLVGNSLMYPPSVFPYPHSAIRFEPRANGRFAASPPGEVVELSGRVADVVCDGWPIYGHWLVDVLPRLHRLMASGIAFDHYLFPGPPRDWQIAMLDLVGLDLSRCRFVDLSAACARCEELVVATYDRFNSEVGPSLTHVHRELVARCATADPDRGGRHLFVSRADWQGSRSLFNRSEVEATFAAAGFEIVHPETLPFPDQIRLFASARTIAGECGSGLHNALFAGRGTRVGILQDPRNHNFLQSQMGMMLDHESFFAVGAPVGGSPDGFTIDPHDARYVASAMLAGLAS